MAVVTTPIYVDDTPHPNRAGSNTISDLIYRYYLEQAGFATPFEVEAHALATPEERADIEQKEAQKEKSE